MVRHGVGVAAQQREARKQQPAHAQQRQNGAAYQLVGFAQQRAVAAQLHLHPQLALADFAHDLADVGRQGLEQGQQLRTGVFGLAEQVGPRVLLLDNPGAVGPHELERVEAGVQHLADALEDNQRPQDEEHRARHLQLVVVNHGLQGVGQVAHAHLLHVERGEVLNQLAQVRLEGPHVGDFGREGQAAEVERHAARVLPGHADEHAREGVLLLLAETAHHAKVDEHDGAVGPHQHVAGVRVGMKSPKLKYLGQVNVHARFGHRGGVQAPGQQLDFVRDFAAAHELNHEDAGRAQLPKRLGNVEGLVRLVQLAELLHRAGLGRVVQLLAHAALERVHDVLRVRQPLLLQETSREAHQLVQQGQVRAHLLAHAGALHFHHHFLAAQ